MRSLLMMLLSIVLISTTVSAIVITEIEDPSNSIPITVTGGENINVSLIKDYFDQAKTDIGTELNSVVDEKISNFEEKIDNYFLTIISKIGLGFLCLTLFIFNLFLGKKLLLDMVFKHG